MNEPSANSADSPTPAPIVEPAVPPAVAPPADPLADMDQRHKVEFMAGRVLEDRNADSPETAMSGKDIYAEAAKLFVTAEVPENTFKQYLSKLVRDAASQINCLGRKQGYYLSAAAKALEEKEAEPVAEPQAKIDEGRREKEKLLYPVLLNWLIEQEYRAKITATGRANGWWGNPDITGIICDESFGNLALEVATIEVKLSEKNWRQWIFEAISHRRFANRSYFAFAYLQSWSKSLIQRFVILANYIRLVFL